MLRQTRGKSLPGNLTCRAFWRSVRAGGRGARVVVPAPFLCALIGTGGLIRFLLYRSGAFEPSGKFTEQSGRSFSSHTGFLLGTLKYGLITGKEELVAWARAAYDYARQHGPALLRQTARPPS